MRPRPPQSPQTSTRLRHNFAGRSTESVCHPWYHMYMEKTTVYLPDSLKTAIRREAASQGVSEAEIIRRSISLMVGDERPEPRGGLFTGNQHVARRADEFLSGFGER